LEMRGIGRGERERRIAEELARVGLVDVADHYPSELSGGMRKRVGLARTLVYEPETVLMDEPFGDLDAQLKQVMQLELIRLWESSRRTILFVTHDLEEAITLADRVIVLSRRPGRVRHVESIDLQRPRDAMHIRFSPRFGELYRSLWTRIEPDVRAAD
jgi:NitT/TauT family transport system ATP-binding protein